MKPKTYLIVSRLKASYAKILEFTFKRTQKMHKNVGFHFKSRTILGRILTHHLKPKNLKQRFPSSSQVKLIKICEYIRADHAF